MNLSDPLFINYFSLIAKIDSFCSILKDNLGEHLNCRKGCDSCCRNISVFPVEAEIVKLSIISLGEDIRLDISNSLNRNPDSCPLLINGICSIYENRPIICRTHGYPILFESDGERKIDYCSMNFNGVDTINGKYLLDVDALNLMLAAVNADFIAKAGIYSCERIFLSELVIQSFYNH